MESTELADEALELLIELATEDSGFRSLEEVLRGELEKDWLLPPPPPHADKNKVAHTSFMLTE